MADARFWLWIAFLCVCLIGGGSSRPEVLSLLYLRPAAVVVLALLLLQPGSIEWSAVRVPLILLGALAATVAVQLVPLPQVVWIALPGHAPFAHAAAVAGMTQPWRPITLVPELTESSLLSFLVPLAAILGFAAVRPRQRWLLVAFLIAATSAGVVLGMLQMTTGTYSPFYVYQVSHRGLPDGFFANRNHQALMLAMMLPVLRAWTLLPSDRWSLVSLRWAAALLATFLFAVLLVIGSRAGLVLAVAGMGGAYALAPVHLDALLAGRKRRLLAIGAAVAVVATIVTVLVFGRAMAIDRLLQASYESELRFRFAPLIVRLIEDFFPFGSGYGSFDAVFRFYEPDWALRRTYFNRAHNDLLELALTGGLSALAVLAAFLIWAMRRAVALWRRREDIAPEVVLARLGAVLVAMMLMASLTDYPLRTPFLAVVFVLSCGWLGGPAVPHQTMRANGEIAFPQGRG